MMSRPILEGSDRSLALKHYFILGGRGTGKSGTLEKSNRVLKNRLIAEIMGMRPKGYNMLKKSGIVMNPEEILFKCVG